MAVSAAMLAAGAIALVATAPVARADDDHGRKHRGENRGKPVQPAQINAKWRQECAACHIAYAPGLLPPESWRKIMAGLDKHFHTDASLTAAENAEITDFLVRNGSNRWSAPTAPLTITETAWFKRKHNEHEIAPAVWKSRRVTSPANCGACHTQAENGDFRERNIRMPGWR
jgi:hypothetical protein